MKTMTVHAATLAVGMALAPMAASAADVPTIAFDIASGGLPTIDQEVLRGGNPADRIDDVVSG